MRRETLSIAGFCALGAFIGTLVALDISTRFEYGSYFWGIGALFGGMTAYVGIDFRHFCAGIVRSYHETLTWRPYALYWKAVGMTWLGFMAMASSCMFVLFIFFFSWDYIETRDLGSVLQDVRFGLWESTFITVATTVFMGVVSFTVNKREGQTPRQYKARLLRSQRLGWENVVEMNPAVIVWQTVYYGSKLLWALIMYSPSLIAVMCLGVVAIIQGIAQFVKRVFIYVHSARRTVCFVDATIGAAIGYTSGSAIVGAITGVVFGVINYEVISVRWLKLASRTTR